MALCAMAARVSARIDETGTTGPARLPHVRLISLVEFSVLVI